MKRITPDLIGWYRLHKRDLPWRRTSDPYRIWLSEIILQQTRVEQGLPFYERFCTLFPTVEQLAGASEREVLKVWQGLGYYSRARNLHEAAQMITGKHKGIFPQTYEEIRALKGVGEYTAAAVASIAFGLPYAVVDGNVKRFITRLYGIESPVDDAGVRRKIRSIVHQLLDKDHPGEFNQAMMEYGARVCVPLNPDCPRCIFQLSCLAFRKNKTVTIPVKSKQKFKKERFFHYLLMLISHNGIPCVVLNQRRNNDIWKNLYDFPLVEHTGWLTERGLFNTSLFSETSPMRGGKIIRMPGEWMQMLTHQIIRARFYYGRFSGTNAALHEIVPLIRLADYPVPVMISRFLSAPGIPFTDEIL